MKNLMKKKWFIPAVAGAVLVIAAIIVIVLVNSNKSYRIIKLEDYEGDVVVNRGSQLLDLFDGLQLVSGDSSSTGEESIMHLLIDTDKHMLVTPNTVFDVKASGTADKGKVRITLQEGKAFFEVDNKLNNVSSFDVVTPNATTSIRGTQFLTSYDPKQNKTHVYCDLGKVEVSYGNNQIIDVNPGEAVTVVDDTVVKEQAVFLDVSYHYDIKSPDFKNHVQYSVSYFEANTPLKELSSTPSFIKSALDKHADDIDSFYEEYHGVLEENIKNNNFTSSLVENVSVWFPNECSFDSGEGNKKYRVEKCEMALIYDETEHVDSEEYYCEPIELNGKTYFVSGVSVRIAVSGKETVSGEVIEEDESEEEMMLLESGRKIYLEDGTFARELIDYEYDEFGRLLSCSSRADGEGGYSYVHKITYEYDENGHLIRRKTENYDYPDYEAVYNEEGVLAYIIVYTGVDRDRFDCICDDDGKPVQLICDEGQWRREFTYDEKNNVTSDFSTRTFQDFAGNDIYYRDNYTYEYVYDENDNILKETRHHINIDCDGLTYEETNHIEYEYKEYPVKEDGEHQRNLDYLHINHFWQ